MPLGAPGPRLEIALKASTLGLVAVEKARRRRLLVGLELLLGPTGRDGFVVGGVAGLGDGLGMNVDGARVLLGLENELVLRPALEGALEAMGARAEGLGVVVAALFGWNDHVVVAARLARLSGIHSGAWEALDPSLVDARLIGRDRVARLELVLGLVRALAREGGGLWTKVRSSAARHTSAACPCERTPKRKRQGSGARALRQTGMRMRTCSSMICALDLPAYSSAMVVECGV